MAPADAVPAAELRRSLTAPGSRPRLRAPHHTAACWKAKRRGSRFRLPERQRAAVLQPGDLLAQQFVSTLPVATSDFKRRRSSSPMSASRVFRQAAPPARKQSRHWARLAAATRYFREVDSRSAPRISSRMTETLRLSDHRPPPELADDCSRWAGILSFRTFCTVPNALSNRIPGRGRPSSLYYLHPPRSPAECAFARLTTCLSADLKTHVTPCQLGGKPLCEECGCMASAGMHGLANLKVGGLVPISAILNASIRVGGQLARPSR